MDVSSRLARPRCILRRADSLEKVGAQTMESEANAGRRYIACPCDDHRNVFADLPWTDAELEIASCMRTCPYCGNEFTSAGNLRAHLKTAQYQLRSVVSLILRQLVTYDRGG